MSSDESKQSGDTIVVYSNDYEQRNANGVSGELFQPADEGEGESQLGFQERINQLREALPNRQDLDTLPNQSDQDLAHGLYDSIASNTQSMESTLNIVQHLYDASKELDSMQQYVPADIAGPAMEILAATPAGDSRIVQEMFDQAVNTMNPQQQGYARCVLHIVQHGNQIYQIVKRTHKLQAQGILSGTKQLWQVVRDNKKLPSNVQDMVATIDATRDRVIAGLNSGETRQSLTPDIDAHRAALNQFIEEIDRMQQNCDHRDSISGHLKQAIQIAGRELRAWENWKKTGKVVLLLASVVGGLCLVPAACYMHIVGFI